MPERSRDALANRERYVFSPVKEGLWVTAFLLEELMAKPPGPLEVSLDLGISFVHADLAERSGAYFLNIGSAELNLNFLSELIRGRTTVFYSLNGSEWLPLEIRSTDNYYRLRAVGAYTAPTIEISGIHMHNIKDTTPWRDAARKVRLLRVRKGDFVLEIGTGLGYTAIHSVKCGARVLSIEKDENVLQLARYNPWSRELESSNINIVLADASEIVGELPDSSFDKIMHDPPTFALAGELYSEVFYRELYRVLKPGGTLFHYTGAPKSRRGIDLQRGIVRRLRAAGFYIQKVLEGYAVIARKPRTV